MIKKNIYSKNIIHIWVYIYYDTKKQKEAIMNKFAKLVRAHEIIRPGCKCSGQRM